MAAGTAALCETLEAARAAYAERAPCSAAAWRALSAAEAGAPKLLCDHVAFRTFGIDGLGVASLGKVLTDAGYTEQDELFFEKKKLRARWYRPPLSRGYLSGSMEGGFLPRVFVSELEMHRVSDKLKELVERNVAGCHAELGVRPWVVPTKADYDTAAEESEYAAWTLAHGYALNHATVSVHNLRSFGAPPESDRLAAVNKLLSEQGFTLNAPTGDPINVSPDGLLRQSSTKADLVEYHFRCGAKASIPGSYVEFAERLALPAHAGVEEEQLTEEMRRDGFESGNADKIFESTFTK